MRQAARLALSATKGSSAVGPALVATLVGVLLMGLGVLVFVTRGGSTAVGSLGVPMVGAVMFALLVGAVVFALRRSP
jgi:hypothetical protein